MKTPILTALVVLVASGPVSADFNLSFEWGDIPLCTSGRPNRVDNPQFDLSGVPDGTDEIVFRLVDLDVPSYNHGGGTVALSGDGAVPSGAFTYKSPCPPNGVHMYEWRATAKGGDEKLGETAAQRPYPE